MRVRSDRRRATPGDEQVLRLFAAALGWRDAPRFERVFRRVQESVRYHLLEPATPAVALVLFRRAERGLPRGWLAVWAGRLLGDQLDALGVAVGALSLASRLSTDHELRVGDVASALRLDARQLRVLESRVLRLLEFRCEVEPAEVDALLPLYWATLGTSCE